MVLLESVEHLQEPAHPRAGRWNMYNKDEKGRLEALIPLGCFFEAGNRSSLASKSQAGPVGLGWGQTLGRATSTLYAGSYSGKD